ncbi:MAG: hypothetical protein EXR43_02730 [Dehalococcoidia bacterium]|nr:hypothetical protein [Dehalococcoidia bacterium]
MRQIPSLTRFRLLLPLVFTCLVLAGCGASAQRDASATNVSAGVERPSAEAGAIAPADERRNVNTRGPTTALFVVDGCNAPWPADLKAGASTRRRLPTALGDREYLLHVPAGATNGRALPLVLNFHGRGSNAAIQEKYSALVPHSDRAGFLLLTPEGSGQTHAWAAGATAPGTVDDVQFIGALIDQLAAEICLDTARVYAVGFSNGAFMASRLACEADGRIVAFAAVAGLSFPGESCTRRIPVLGFHAMSDSSVPFERGMVRGTYAYPGARDSARNWAARNGCTAPPAPEKMNDRTTKEAYGGCVAPVVLYITRGGAHAWPEASSGEIDAAGIIWAFFAGQQLH